MDSINITFSVPAHLAIEVKERMETFLQTLIAEDEAKKKAAAKLPSHIWVHNFLNDLWQKGSDTNEWATEQEIANAYWASGHKDEDFEDYISDILTEGTVIDELLEVWGGMMYSLHGNWQDN